MTTPAARHRRRSPTSPPTDLDPQGDGEENPDEVAGAVDGDPATSWTTLTYKQQLGPDGLKRGVGLVVDLGQSRAVRRVDLTLVGQPTALSLYLTDTVPDNPEKLTPVGDVARAHRRRRPSTRRRTHRALPHDLVHLPPLCRRRIQGWDR